MARSEYKTWLSLDEFAQILGFNPLGFNQLSSALFPNNVCGDITMQSDYQHSDRIGRETIAMTIQQAEHEMAREVGYNLMPDWTLDERLSYPRPSFPEAYNLYGYNPRYQLKSVEATRGHIISGGIRAKSLIESGAAVVRSDTDGDGYSETCTVISAVTITDTNEIHLYYPAKSGVDEWEIRPIKVSISGGNATIQFKAWQIVAANQLDALNPEPLDAADAASYETTVDVYRVYNDPSTQAQLMWESDPGCLDCYCGSCYACQFGTQTACFHLRDPRIGFLVPAPATWDATNLRFNSAYWSACHDPDQVRLWYYSGYRDNSLLRPYVEMSPYWEYAVAYYAAAKLDRPVCGCSNVSEFIEKWRTDLIYTSEAGGFTITPEMASNKLGTTMGALYAYRRIHQNGIRVNK